jgi:apolipoprotein N-acyltransferase
MCLYLAAYLPAFVCLTRIATRQLRVPLVLAAPVIWVGLECLQGWLLTGFSMAVLGHTQIHWLPLVQISDLAGAYAVSFVVMFVAAAIAGLVPLGWIILDGTKMDIRSSPTARNGPVVWPIGAAAALVAATVGYGYFRLHEALPGEAASGVRIALVQGSIDTVFGDPTLDKRTSDQYEKLNEVAKAERPHAILWPESVLPLARIERDPSGKIEAGRVFNMPVEQLERTLALTEIRFVRDVYELGRNSDIAPAATNDDAATGEHIPLLLGGNTLRFGPHNPRRYNSAIFVDEQGKVAGVYHKMHPVMFGEYAPGGKLFPWIYKLMPIPDGLTPGERPEAFTVQGLKLSPSVCFENTVPHLIRRQVAQLRRQRSEPDVLVTLSNDGWFWGSSELDMHLTCGRFRAMELHKPALIAANTGLSAHIDGNGRLLQVGPRRQTQVLIAEVKPDGRASIYSRIGDAPANFCLLACLAVAVVGTIGWWRSPRE